MTTTKIKYFIAALTLAVFMSCLAGIGTGLPSKEQTELVFSGQAALNALSPAMKLLRDEVYNDYSRQNKAELKKTYTPTNEKISIDINGNKVSVDKNKLHAMRSALLQSKFPEEPKALMSFSFIKPSKLQFNLHYYQYGGLYMYSCGAALKICQLLKVLTISSDAQYYFTHPDDVIKLYSIPKLWGGLVGSMAIPCIFLCGWRLFGIKQGVTAAVLFALVPQFYVEAHCFKPYVFFIPFMLLSIYFAVSIMETGKLKYYVLAGLFAGLGAGSLVLSAVAIFAPLTAHLFYCYKKESVFNKKILAMSAVFLAALLLTNPYYVLSFNEMRSEFLANTNEVGFAISFRTIFKHLFQSMPSSFGIIYFLAIPGIVFSLVKPDRKTFLVIPVFFAYYLYLLNTLWYNPHYNMPLVPVAILLAARFTVWLGDKLRWNAALKFSLLIIGIYAFGNVLFYENIFASDKAHLLSAGSWINENIQKGSSINSVVYPYYDCCGDFPPFSLLDYRINETKNPDYYLSVGGGLFPEVGNAFFKSDEFIKSYEPVKTFSLTFPYAGRFYRNNLLYFLGQDIKIYKLKQVIS
jgi:hypothetical protein